jgi:hypothetical protein
LLGQITLNRRSIKAVSRVILGMNGLGELRSSILFPLSATDTPLAVLWSQDRRQLTRGDTHEHTLFQTNCFGGLSAGEQHDHGRRGLSFRPAITPAFVGDLLRPAGGHAPVAYLVPLSRQFLAVRFAASC